MFRSVRIAVLCVGICAVIGLRVETSHAGTIIKLSLSEAPADVVFNGVTLATIDDGDGATTGNQNTSAIFLDFLDSKHVDILPPAASFSLAGLTGAAWRRYFPP